MNPRLTEIYVTPQIKRRLFWILKQDKKTTRDATLESVTERLLNEKMETDYPGMKTLEKRMDALEDQLVEEMGNPQPEK